MNTPEQPDRPRLIGGVLLLLGGLILMSAPLGRIADLVGLAGVLVAAFIMLKATGFAFTRRG